MAPAGLSLVCSSFRVETRYAVSVRLAFRGRVFSGVGYDVTDAQGATVHQTETITITGTNDVPEIGRASSRERAESAVVDGLDQMTGASDKDDGETESLSVGNVTEKVGAG